MKASVLERQSGWHWVILAGGALLSLLLHGALAFAVTRIPPKEPNRPVWIEAAMIIHDPPPPPPPRPEPPKPKLQPKEPIAFRELPPEAPAVAAPPEPKKVRRIQGFDQESFLKGAGTGFSVRAGNTTTIRATAELEKLENAKDFSIAYTSVSSPPRVRTNPPIDVPPELVAAQVEGRVEVELTVSAEGAVTEATVTHGLHPLADAACREHFLRRTHWQPSLVDGQPVAVKGVPQSCRFEILQ